MLSNVKESKWMFTPLKMRFGALLPPWCHSVTVDLSLRLDWPVCLHPSSQPSGRINLFCLSLFVCLFVCSLHHCLCLSVTISSALSICLEGAKTWVFTVILALNLTSRFIQSHSCIKAAINNHFTSFNLSVTGSRAKDYPLSFSAPC